MKLQADYPVKLLYEVLALPRSSWYFKSAKSDEAALPRAVEQVVEQFPTYGSRRVTHQLRRDNAEFKTMGRKRVRRVIGEMGLKCRSSSFVNHDYRNDKALFHKPETSSRRRRS